VETSAELRVVLADDHDMFRTALRQLLEENGPLRVVGEAATGEGAVTQVREQAPDVVVMDLAMPGLGGVEATRLIIDEAPHTSVVVLTVSEEASDVVDAIVAGACGYLLKSGPVEKHDLRAEPIVRASGDHGELAVAGKHQVAADPRGAERRVDQHRVHRVHPRLPPHRHHRQVPHDQVA